MNTRAHLQFYHGGIAPPASSADSPACQGALPPTVNPLNSFLELCKLRARPLLQAVHHRNKPGVGFDAVRRDLAEADPRVELACELFPNLSRGSQIHTDAPPEVELLRCQARGAP